jgi:hypothetical protein
MKNVIVILSLVFLVSAALHAQKKNTVEVMYFKANLACCQAKSCAMLENDVKAIVEKNFSDGTVIFREIKLADEANKELVEKYKAQSQTVVLVQKTKKGEKSMDISDIVKTYRQNQNKEELEKALMAKVSEIKTSKK